jgi:hypothetical protein
MIAVIELICDAQRRFALWVGTNLLGACLVELASGRTYPFLRWPAMKEGALRLPRIGGGSIRLRKRRA